MPVRLQYRTNIPRVQRWLNKLATEDVPRVIADTINDIAFKGKVEETRQIEKDIDRPRPFTTRENQFLVRKVSQKKINSGAVVRMKDIQANYMRWTVYGGTKKGSSKGIPVGPANQRNKFGNTPGYKNFVSKRKGDARFFIVDMRNRNKSTRHLKPGVYRKYKNKKRHPKKVMGFYRKTAFTKRQYKFARGYKRFTKANVRRLFIKNVKFRINNGPQR